VRDILTALALAVFAVAPVVAYRIEARARTGCMYQVKSSGERRRGHDED
jgi:hypothetical protein